jgi:hypothetical protein
MRGLFILLALSAFGSASAADTSQPSSADSKTAKEKLVCKREVPIGSLIASRKRCMTKAQWIRLAEDQQYEAEKMVEQSRGRIGGN